MYIILHLYSLISVLVKGPRIPMAVQNIYHPPPNHIKPNISLPFSILVLTWLTEKLLSAYSCTTLLITTVSHLIQMKNKHVYKGTKVENKNVDSLLSSFFHFGNKQPLGLKISWRR